MKFSFCEYKFIPKLNILQIQIPPKFDWIIKNNCLQIFHFVVLKMMRFNCLQIYLEDMENWKTKWGFSPNIDAPILAKATINMHFFNELPKANPYWNFHFVNIISIPKLKNLQIQMPPKFDWINQKQMPSDLSFCCAKDNEIQLPPDLSGGYGKLNDKLWL